MAINQTLKKLGLNDKEIQVYLALLKSGKTKPSVLANLTKLKRASLYHIAKGLLAKGLISEDFGGKTLQFVPLPPESLEKILEQSKRELAEKETLIKKAISEISLISAEKAYPVPKIRFIEENNLKKFLFDNLVKWQKEVINADGVWWGFQDHSFVENYSKWISATWQTKESKDKHYQAQIFTNESKIEAQIKNKYPKDKRRVRFLANQNFTATLWVCGDYLIVIATHQHPFYSFEIHDQLLAQNMRETFKKLWEVS
ncbi:MAG: helix-turn-helix domain-containing protein [Patescibacteria group bacterium]|nr:helix-turn-helix domain-containing protein [Patescibacteria group bacterium]